MLRQFTMSNICENILRLKEKINLYEKKYGREINSVKLLAVSKTHGKDIIIDARKCGQKYFGENYLKESIEKINQLREYDLSWHYIGNIQSNKIKYIAENFDWVHSIDSIQSLEKLSKYRPENYGNINVCLQVNIDDEKSKSGVKINEVDNFFTQAGALGSVNLRGLMAIPKQTNEYNLQVEKFQILKDCFEDLLNKGFSVDTLSMGMSNDFKAAIKCGATIIRVGTAIFGERVK